MYTGARWTKSRLISDVCFRWVANAMLILFALSIALCPAGAFRNLSDKDSLNDMGRVGNMLESYVTELVDYSCGRSSFCNASSRRYGTWKCMQCADCHCDELCHQYNDCCLDKHLEGSESGRGPDISSYISCIVPFPRHEPLLLVAKCPTGAKNQPDIVARCETPVLTKIKHRTIVSESRTNLTFRNEYCARCHGIHTFQAWTNQASCVYSPQLSEMTSKAALWKYALDTCNITVHPPENVTARKCRLDTISSCNNSGNWAEWNQTIETLCLTLNSPVRYINPFMNPTKPWYKNKFCLLCDGIKLAPRFAPCYDGAKAFDGFPAPLSVLLDFNREDSILQPVVPSTCEVNSVLDPFEGTCKEMQCSDRRLLSNRKCVPKFAAVQWLGYSFSLTLTTSEKLNMSDWSNITDMYVEHARRVFMDFTPYVLTPMNLTVYMTSSPAPARQHEQWFHSLLIESRIATVSPNTSTHDFEEKLRSLPSNPWEVRIGGSLVVFHAVFSSCQHPIKHDNSFVSIYAEDAVFDNPKWLSPFSINKCDLGCVESIRYVNIETVLDCPNVRYNLSTSEFIINQTSNEVIFDDMAAHVNNSDFYACGNDVKICAHVLEKIASVRQSSLKTAKLEEWNTLAKVSLVSVVLSLVALFLTFLVYSLLPKLRTLPGKNTMALIFHLFLAQLLFLTGISSTSNFVVCQIMGVFIHYFWMATFAWTTICAYHMYRVFTDLLASRHHSLSERSILIRFCLCANLSSLVVVLGCLGYHLISTQGRQSGYGGLNCFLTDAIVLGVTFAAPICFVLLCNVFFFVRTVLSIRNIPNMKSATHNCNRHHALIYFRLSVLLGFTWLFGLVKEIKTSMVLEYLFVILTGCQGIFIFIAFCLSRRTLGLLKDKFIVSRFKQNGSTSTPRTDSTSM